MDKAGNKEQPKTIIIKIDKTPPAITGAPISSSNATGWYNTDVTVHFEAMDAVSGLDTVTPDTTLNLEGVNQAITGTATDKAGNKASFTVIGINIDKTLPELTVNFPVEGCEYLLGQTVLANYEASDGLSGIDQITGTVPPGTAIDTTSPGLKTFTVTAMDNAGNQVTKTITYRVIYAFNLTQQNLDGKIHKLGSTIPVKFQLKDDKGSFITTATAKLFMAKITEGSIGEEQDAVSTSSATTANLFRYDSTVNQYIFNLGTKDLTAGTWQLKILLDDGTSKTLTIILK